MVDKVTDFSRTIVALATALGSGSIGIIRISGPQAVVIANKVFVGINLEQVAPNTVHFGRIKAESRYLDQVLATVFHAPHSYTGENCVEISCHANPFVADSIIQTLIEAGADPARPGEYTLRAFLNGKMDLSQAEAVAAIIRSKTPVGVENSLGQLSGKLTREISDIRQEIIDLLGLVELDLDFSEENLNVAGRTDITERIKSISHRLQDLSDSYNYARFLENGVKLAIIGEPNVGKSTLLNYLIGENRAITSHIPGTTRDILRESVMIDRILYQITDTAGLRLSTDEVETEGIRRAHDQIHRADQILLVFDAHQALASTSIALIESEINRNKEKLILVGNKKDLGLANEIKPFLKKWNVPFVFVSAREGQNMSGLVSLLKEQTAQRHQHLQDDIIVTEKRQYDIFIKCAQSMARAGREMATGKGYEFISVDVRDALDRLGEITGETVTDDILNNIFSGFCIGK